MNSNMVSKRKKSCGEKHSSNIETCHYTHLRLGILALRNYKRLARGSNKEDEGNNDYSAISTPRPCESSRFEETIVHLTGSFSEMNQRLEALVK